MVDTLAIQGREHCAFELKTGSISKRSFECCGWCQRTSRTRSTEDNLLEVVISAAIVPRGGSTEGLYGGPVWGLNLTPADEELRRYPYLITPKTTYQEILHLWKSHDSGGSR